MKVYHYLWKALSINHGEQFIIDTDCLSGACHAAVLMAESTAQPWKLTGSSSNPTVEMGSYSVKDFKYFKSSLNLVSEGMEMSMAFWDCSFPNRNQVKKEGFGLNI